MSLKIRRCKLSDAEYLFKLANDPVTRKNSFNNKTIEWSEHVKWLNKKLNNPESFVFIITKDKIPVGTIKIETNKDETIIGVIVDPDYRGIGLGAEIIKIGCKEYWKYKRCNVFAYIKKDNHASIKVFQKANFNYLEDTIIEGTESIKLIAKKNGN